MNARLNQITSHAPELSGAAALFAAALSQHYDEVRGLLAAGLEVDVRDPERGYTLLMLAARTGDRTLIELLLEFGADPNIQGGRQLQTALHLASAYLHNSCARLLLQAGASLNPLNYKRQTPLHLLCMREIASHHIIDAQEMLEMLIGGGAEVEWLDSENASALHYCAVNNHTALAEILLKAGANPNVRTGDNNVTPLHIAALEKFGDMADLLYRYGAEMYSPCRLGAMPADYLGRRAQNKARPCPSEICDSEAQNPPCRYTPETIKLEN